MTAAAPPLDLQRERAYVRDLGRAFAGGRGFHDTDRTLLSLPPDQRRAVLLEYEHWGRDSRDRSFEIPSLSTCATRPYFYPTLPLAAAGLHAVTGIRSISRKRRTNSTFCSPTVRLGDASLRTLPPPKTFARSWCFFTPA